MGVWRGAVVGLALMLFLVAAGCGSKKGVPVSGTVTWQEDGKAKEPLKKGNIKFVSDEHKGVEPSGTIQDGSYKVEVPPGKWKVEVRATREKPGAKADPAMGAVPQEQFIPERYNAKTKLTAEVPAKGSVTLPEFELKQKE